MGVCEYDRVVMADLVRQHDQHSDVPYWLCAERNNCESKTMSSSVQLLLGALKCGSSLAHSLNLPVTNSPVWDSDPTTNTFIKIYSLTKCVIILEFSRCNETRS